MAESSRFWRWVPLGSAAVVYLAAALSFGLGFILGPLTLIPVAIAYRQTQQPRSAVFWVGAATSALLAAFGLVILAGLAFEALE